MRTVRIVVIALATFCLSPATALARETPPAVTRVWLSKKCVVVENAGANIGGQELAPVFAAILTAIIPSLVNKSVDAAAAALQAKANDKERKVSAAVGENFYQTKSDLSVNPAEKIGCLTIAHGKFPVTALNPAFTGFFAGTEKRIQQALIDHGVKATPDVYLEMTFEFSQDGRAFRLVPQLLVYPKAVRGKNSGEFGGLAMIATFRGPAAKEATESFALGSIAFTQARPGHDYQSGQLGENYRTNWMPLPAIDADLRASLTSQIQNRDAAATSARKRDAYLAENDSKGVKISSLPKLKRNDGTALCPISLQRPFANDAAQKAYSEWKTELAARIFEIERAKAVLQASLDAAPTAKKPPIAADLRDVDTALNALKECLGAETAADLVSAAADKLEMLVPFDVQVTLVESFEPSKFLAFAAGVLTDSKEGLKTALTAEIDPTTKEAAAKAREKERMDAEIAARQAWADAMKAQLEYESETDTLKKAKAALDLELSKRKANRAYRDLGWAPPFPEYGD